MSATHIPGCRSDGAFIKGRYNIDHLQVIKLLSGEITWRKLGTCITRPEKVFCLTKSCRMATFCETKEPPKRTCNSLSLFSQKHEHYYQIVTG